MLKRVGYGMYERVKTFVRKTEEEKREIRRVLREARFLARAMRQDGEEVELWILPEGEVVKVVEAVKRTKRRRLNLLTWTKENLESLFHDMANGWKSFRHWKTQSLEVIERNWTEEEKRKVEEWAEREELLVDFIFDFAKGNLTKENIENSHLKQTVNLPENFWQWDRNRQEHFLIKLYGNHREEGIRKGYDLFIKKQYL